MQSNRKYILVSAAVTAVLLMIIAVWLLYSHFSYGKEWADYEQMYQTAEGPAVFVDDTLTSYHALFQYGIPYLSVEMVKDELNDRFYVSSEGTLLYTLPDETVEVAPEQRLWRIGGVVTKTDWPVCHTDKGALYVAVEYVALFTDMEYEFYEDPGRLLIRQGSGEETWAQVTKKAQVRGTADRKALILAETVPGDEVCVLETGDDWTRVRTADGFIGYLPSKALGEASQRKYAADCLEQDYTGTGAQIRPPVCLAWHQVFVEEANRTLTDFLEDTEGITVISPTWFALSDEEGGFTSLADQEYVDEAHERGLAVWGLINDFDRSVDKYSLLSRTFSRRALINNLVSEALDYGLDGINIDFELIDQATGEHFIQFIRELSVECRKEGLVLSVDNYSLVGGRSWYHVKEQGIVADFVIMMGYDEHWSGGSPGSTASISFTEDTIRLALGQVPAEKLIHGIPFYTRVWGEENGVNVSSAAAGMEAAKALLEENGAELNWLEEEGQYFGEYISDGVKYSIWLEDETSLRLKLDAIQESELAGVACWKLGLEDKSIWPVISEYLEYLK